MSNDANPPALVPTVVVSRRVRSGSEEEFRTWDRRLRAAAAAADGFLGSDVQPPNPSHPGEWVRVYSFDTADHLDAWLVSDERRALVAEAEAMIEGPAREQRVARPRAASEPVTVVFSQRIAPENHDEFITLHDNLVDIVAGFPGFLGSELLQPVEGVQDDHVIVASFRSRADLDRWLASEERAGWVTRAERLVEGDRTMNVVGGFGGWFPAGESRPEGPKRWKQAVAVFIALFPTSLLITFVRGEVAPDMNVVFGVFAGNVIGILVLTYVLMPIVTRMLRNWLAR